MKSLALLALALEGTLAFPSVLNTLSERDVEGRAAAQGGCTTSALCNKKITISNSQIGYNPKAPTAAQQASANRNQGGALAPITTFDGDAQLVSTTGNNAYQSPSASQIRGPCPGLNAAANHNYLPRSGVPTITQTITGLGSLYGMSVDLAGFLAAYAVAIDGDLVSLSWSIGGPPPSLLGSAQGISYSHNKYEGDTSIGRCDAYINGGDAHSLSTVKFGYAYASGMDDDRYTFDKFARAFTMNTFRSEMTNPRYFAPLFSTTLVSPAAYNFVIAMMSNHTADKVDGYLDGAIFKEFFGITGDYPNFTWKKGQERVPDNWYRRPTAQPYTASGGVFGDLISEFLAYPHSFRFGGNTNGVNTYTGISLTDFTGGVYNAKNLFKGNNFQCFVYQNIQQGLPDVLTAGLLSTKALSFLNPYLTKAFGGVSCPQVSKFNDNNLPPYPGRSYSPTPPANAPNNW